MMQYPLTIEQFQCPEFETDTGRKFITAFTNLVNDIYELGRKVNLSNFHLIDRVLKTWKERISEGDEGDIFLEVLTEYVYDAWQHGIKASEGGKDDFL